MCWDEGVGWKERDEQIIPIKYSTFVDYDSGFGLDLLEKVSGKCQYISKVLCR